MIRRGTALRRLLALRAGNNGQQREVLRSFHACSVVGADALDMVDTFARRHCEFSSFLGFDPMQRHDYVVGIPLSR
jgi:hypothetical protein